MRPKPAGTWAIVVMVCGLSCSAWAGEPAAAPVSDPIDRAMGRYRLHAAFAKLGRGLSNIAGGWLEVPANVGLYRSSRDTGGSFFTGLTYGLVRGVARTGVGFYETVTFPIPFPKCFAPILPTLPYYRKTPSRPRLPLE
jgi:putative exosortase-associated protein (TIGR04073 family)